MVGETASALQAKIGLMDSAAGWTPQDSPHADGRLVSGSGGYVGVPLRQSDVGVAEDLLNNADVNALLY